LTTMFSLFLIPTTTVYAGCHGGNFINPLGYCNISSFLSAVLNAVVLITFPIIVLFIVYSGFLFVAAQGNEEKLGKAKKLFFWTIIGALLVLGASALSGAIEGTVQKIAPDVFR